MTKRPGFKLLHGGSLEAGWLISGGLFPCSQISIRYCPCVLVHTIWQYFLHRSSCITGTLVHCEVGVPGLRGVTALLGSWLSGVSLLSFVCCIPIVWSLLLSQLDRFFCCPSWIVLLSPFHWLSHLHLFEVYKFEVQVYKIY